MKRLYFGLLVIPLLLIMFKEFKFYPKLSQHKRLGLADSSRKFLSTDRGVQKRFSLPDGSTVWLNAATTVSFPGDYGVTNRSVEVFGEAFFDVVASPSKPFTVRAKDLSIQVLGTRFSVRDYPDEVVSKAIVTSGSIKVQYLEQATVLNGGQQVLVDPSILEFQKMNVSAVEDTTVATSWMGGVLTYDRIDLRSLLRDLSRLYNIDVQLVGHASNRLYGGSLSVNEPIEEVIERIIDPYQHVSVSRVGKNRIVITVVE